MSTLKKGPGIRSRSIASCRNEALEASSKSERPFALAVVVLDERYNHHGLRRPDKISGHRPVELICDEDLYNIAAHSEAPAWKDRCLRPDPTVLRNLTNPETFAACRRARQARRKGDQNVL